MPLGTQIKTAWLRMHRDERGTAAVSFILCLPIFIVIVSTIVQFALIVNAKIMVTHAAAQAARAGITSLPEELPENVRKAAAFALAPISPKSGEGNLAEAGDIYEALTTLGAKVGSDFPSRYTYANNAMTLTYPQLQYKNMAGQDLPVTIEYKFQLTVPWAIPQAIKGKTTVSGVTGYFWTVKSTVIVKSSHGRAANADWTGWPQ